MDVYSTKSPEVKHWIMTAQSFNIGDTRLLLMRCSEDKKVAEELKQADVGVGGLGVME